MKSAAKTKTGSSLLNSPFSFCLVSSMHGFLLQARRARSVMSCRDLMALVAAVPVASGQEPVSSGSGRVQPRQVNRQFLRVVLAEKPSWRPLWCHNLTRHSRPSNLDSSVNRTAIAADGASRRDSHLPNNQDNRCDNHQSIRRRKRRVPQYSIQQELVSEAIARAEVASTVHAGSRSPVASYRLVGKPSEHLIERNHSPFRTSVPDSSSNTRRLPDAADTWREVNIRSPGNVYSNVRGIGNDRGIGHDDIAGNSGIALRTSHHRLGSFPLGSCPSDSFLSDSFLSDNSRLVSRRCRLLWQTSWRLVSHSPCSDWHSSAESIRHLLGEPVP